MEHNQTFFRKGSSFVFIILLSLFFSCNLLEPTSNNQDRKNEEFLLLNLFNLTSDPNQKLFRFVPIFRNEIGNEQFLNVFQNDSNKPKIIFVHGWNPKERSSQPSTTNTDKITNILSTFRNGIVHFQLNRSSASTSYDLYLYTYRTSNSVATNGDSFVRALNQNFKTTDRVFVIAHSMGGLVTRSAIKNSAYSVGLIDGVVTLGTPYYGSPFANKNYFEASSLLAELVGFLTETEGGQNLSHWNSGLNQPTITSAENSFLAGLENSFPALPSFISFYGNLSSNCQTSLFAFYQVGCQIMNANSPKFPENDGVVPKNSATRGGNVLTSFEYLGFDHSMIAFQANDLDDSRSIQLFERVIQALQRFTE